MWFHRLSVYLVVIFGSTQTIFPANRVRGRRCVERSCFSMERKFGMIPRCCIGAAGFFCIRCRCLRFFVVRDDVILCFDDVTWCFYDATLCFDDVTWCFYDITRCFYDATQMLSWHHPMLWWRHPMIFLRLLMLRWHHSMLLWHHSMLRWHHSMLSWHHPMLLWYHPMLLWRHPVLLWRHRSIKGRPFVIMISSLQYTMLTISMLIESNFKVAMSYEFGHTLIKHHSFYKALRVPAITHSSKIQRNHLIYWTLYIFIRFNRVTSLHRRSGFSRDCSLKESLRASFP